MVANARARQQALLLPDNGLVDDATIVIWAKKMLKYRSKAQIASIEYERVKPIIESEIRQDHPEDYSFRKAMAANWTLNDLLKRHAWFRDEANSLNLAIMGQKALRDILGITNVK